MIINKMFSFFFQSIVITIEPDVIETSGDSLSPPWYRDEESISSHLQTHWQIVLLLIIREKSLGVIARPVVVDLLPLIGNTHLAYRLAVERDDQERDRDDDRRRSAHGRLG